MTITFDNDKDAIVYALEKLISFSRENCYLFVAQCIWWIAGIFGITEDLVIHIDKLAIRRRIGLRQISSTPRDIARDISDQPANNLLSVSDKKDNCDPLRRTRKGRINPLPQTKKQLKQARKAKARQVQ